jgi:hypothetical protein
VKTIDTPSCGQLPVIGTLHDCRNVRTGWTGVDARGVRFNVTHAPETRELGPARIPPAAYIVVGDRDGAAMGVILIERATRRKTAAHRPSAR